MIKQLLTISTLFTNRLDNLETASFTEYICKMFRLQYNNNIYCDYFNSTFFFWENDAHSKNHFDRRQHNKYSFVFTVFHVAFPNICLVHPNI